MMRMKMSNDVIHKQAVGWSTESLCGKKDSKVSMVASNDKDVTCKLCLKIINKNG